MNLLNLWIFSEVQKIFFSRIFLCLCLRAPTRHRCPSLRRDPTAKWGLLSHDQGHRWRTQWWHNECPRQPSPHGGDSLSLRRRKTRDLLGKNTMTWARQDNEECTPTMEKRNIKRLVWTDVLLRARQIIFLFHLSIKNGGRERGGVIFPI